MPMDSDSRTSPGRADFSFLSTSIPGEHAFPASGGNSFASLLLGDAVLGRTETIRNVNQNYPYYGFYAQDDWRINRKLTLNYGLRYEFTLPPRSGIDEYSDFDPTRPNPGADGYPGRADVRRLRTRPREHAVAGSRLVRRMGTAHRTRLSRPTTRHHSAPRSGARSAV